MLQNLATVDSSASNHQMVESHADLLFAHFVIAEGTQSKSHIMAAAWHAAQAAAAAQNTPDASAATLQYAQCLLQRYRMEKAPRDLESALRLGLDARRLAGRWSADWANSQQFLATALLAFRREIQATTTIAPSMIWAITRGTLGMYIVKKSRLRLRARR